MKNGTKKIKTNDEPLEEDRVNYFPCEVNQKGDMEVQIADGEWVVIPEALWGAIQAMDTKSLRVVARLFRSEDGVKAMRAMVMNEFFDR